MCSLGPLTEKKLSKKEAFCNYYIYLSPALLSSCLILLLQPGFLPCPVVGGGGEPGPLHPQPLPRRRQEKQLKQFSTQRFGAAPFSDIKILYDLCIYCFLLLALFQCRTSIKKNYDGEEKCSVNILNLKL